MTIFRKYRRMTEEEQKATGYPTDNESIQNGVSPIELILGFDPFLTYDDVKSTETKEL
jgi:hypothetical protein